MSFRHLVHPELRDLLATMPERRYSDATLPAARAQLREIARRLPALGNAGVSVETVRIAGSDDPSGVEALLFRPRSGLGPFPAMLQIHGGGFINGSPELGGGVCQSLAEELGCVVLAPRYRLAPEVRYPGPQRDCHAALAWLFDNAARLEVDDARIGVGGDSAGGGLAAATCLRARDEGLLPVAFQHLLYPMLDDRPPPAGTRAPHAGAFIWTPDNDAYAWRAMIGDEAGGEEVPAYCAPARASDLVGLPPTFIAVGSLDLFLDQDIEYARRLAHAGVEIELHVYPGAFHGFDISETAAPARAFRRDRLDWLRSRTAPVHDETECDPEP